MSHSASPLAPALSLAAVETGRPYQVVALTSDASHADMASRLAELGFLPGESVAVLARGMPGGEPLAVRIGLSTFALPRAEAVCVQVRPVEAR